MPQEGVMPVSIEIVSDEEEERDPIDAVYELSTPFASQFKRPRIDPHEARNPTILVIDDDPTPEKPGVVSSAPSPLLVPETPLSMLSKPPEVAIVKSPQARPSSAEEKFSGIRGLISLESDNESESGLGKENWKGNDTIDFGFDGMEDSALRASYVESMYSLGNTKSSQMSGDGSLNPSSPSQYDIIQVNNQLDSDNVEAMDDVLMQSTKVNVKEKESDKATGKKRLTKEERTRMLEEKKQKKEQEKLRKAALKAEIARMKKLEKERQKWEKGASAVKSIVAEIDTKVVEGSVGGHLLSRLSEKGLTFRITSNPIKRSIVWTMSIPEEISQVSSKGTVIPYVSLVFEAEEFCNFLLNESLVDHVSRVQRCYPSYTVCYLTNRLMAFVNKREQAHYKNPANSNGWRRPPVEESIAKLATHFYGVRSRLCIDEAELAEHVVGLTTSLAACQFRKRLSRLSVNANGSFIPKDSVDRNLIKKSVWLKALVSIPKVQPRFAIAIWKKYPTMKSLLSVYMDPSKSVHEKEFLLQDLSVEGLLGDNRRLGEICSKRVYRVLMAQSGSIKTDDVEYGADFFTR